MGEKTMLDERTIADQAIDRFAGEIKSATPWTGLADLEPQDLIDAKNKALEGLATEPRVDYGKLNEQAAFLFDTAFARGKRAGEDEAISNQARYHAAANHDLAAVALANALRSEDNEECRLWGLHARRILSRTPMIRDELTTVLTHLGHANLNDSSRAVDRRQLMLAGQLNQHALDELGGYR